MITGALASEKNHRSHMPLCCQPASTKLDAAERRRESEQQATRRSASMMDVLGEGKADGAVARPCSCRPATD